MNQLLELIEMALGNKRADRRKLKQGLKSRDEIVVLAALEAVDSHYDYDLTEDILPLIFHHNLKIKKYAFKAVQTDPLFHFERRSAMTGTSSLPSRKAHFLERLFSKERISRLSDILKNIPERDFRESIASLAELPGVHHLALNDIFSGSKRRCRNQFEHCREIYCAQKYPRQISVVPSYACHLGCSYCFAKGLDEEFSKRMTIVNFRKVLDILGAGKNVKIVNFLGGEPTIFPEFHDFIEETKRRKMEFYFATNGIVPADAFQKILSHENLLNVTFHMEKTDFYSKTQRNVLFRNLKKCGEEGIPAVIRYNLSEPGFRNWHFLLDCFDALPGCTFSFAVPFPSQAGNNQYIPLSELRAFSPKIVALVNFIKKGDSSKIPALVLAKPYPPCFFSEGELKFILKHVLYKNVCELDKNSGTQNVCINPDLSYFPCMALNSKKYNFSSLSTWENLALTSQRRVHKIISRPVLKNCETCSLHLSGACQAACYSYLS